MIQKGSEIIIEGLSNSRKKHPLFDLIVLRAGYNKDLHDAILKGDQKFLDKYIKNYPDKEELSWYTDEPIKITKKMKDEVKIQDDEITRSLREGKQVKEAIDWTQFEKDLRNDKVNKKMKSICNKYGYDLTRPAYIRSNGLPVIAVTPIDRNSYHPDIFFDYDKFGKKGQYWEIQTSSYGFMNVKEHEKYIKSCQDANNMVKELEKIDLYKELTKEPEDIKLF